MPESSPSRAQKSGRTPLLKTCQCGREIEVGIADFGREWSWICLVSDGGCGAVLGSEPREPTSTRTTTPVAESEHSP